MMDSTDIQNTIILCKLKNGKVHQVIATKQTMRAILLTIGQMEGSLKLLETEIEGIDIT